MDYDQAKARLTRLGCQFLTEDEFQSLLRGKSPSFPMFYPRGCPRHADIDGVTAFTHVLYALYPTDPATAHLLCESDPELRIAMLGDINCTVIARCRVCGSLTESVRY